MMASPRDEPLIGLSPVSKDIFGIQKNYQPSAPRAHHTPSASASKKGAQPSADGFFHCRLCDKCFEKVKSLNAHMKSHAMKARAEQEAKAHDAQIAAAAAQLTSAVNNTVTTSPLNFNGHLGISIPSTIGNLTPQQLTPQQLNLNQQLQSQLNTLSTQLNSQLNSPMTPQQQLQQFTQQQLVARMQQVRNRLETWMIRDLVLWNTRLEYNCHVSRTYSNRQLPPRSCSHHICSKRVYTPSTKLLLPILKFNLFRLSGPSFLSSSHSVA